MPVDPISAGTLALGLKLLEKPLGALQQSAAGAVKSLVKKWEAAGVRDRAVQLVEEVEKVRTISNSTPTSLSSFYYPSRVQDEQGKPPRTVQGVADLGPSKNVLIVGTVGQGKSILMRHLCIQELKRGEKIPVFIELRTLSGSDTVAQKIKDCLTLLGFFDIDDEVYSFLLKSGQLIIFLDAFDELKRELALSVQQELAVLSTRFPSTKLIISSRPGSLSAHIAGIPQLRQVRIFPLREEDFDPFLARLGLADSQRSKLVNAILNSPGEIKGVLKTPLMLTLLQLTFGTSTNIPDTLHEFYESMFLFLVYRHDETKPGYVRQKATSLSNAQLQEVFEYFSYLAKEFGVALSDEEFNQCCKNAARLTSMEFTAEGLRTDLTETVCLMQRDGLKTAFTHRSIQEFFAAFFVKHINNEEMAKRIYEKIRTSLAQWQQELNFLSQIDRYRYIEYHRLPALRKLFADVDFKGERKIPVTKGRFVSLLGTQPIVMYKSNGAKNKYVAIVVPKDGKYTSFTMEIAKLFCDELLIGDITFLGGPKNNPIIVPVSKYARSNPAELQSAYEKFLEQTRKFEKEVQRLERTLADRQDVFRDILFNNMA